VYKFTSRKNASFSWAPSEAAVYYFYVVNNISASGLTEKAITYMNSKQVNATVNRLLSLMGDVKNGNLRTIIANLQTMCEYQAEKIRIYEEHLTELTGKTDRS